MLCSVAALRIRTVSSPARAVTGAMETQWKPAKKRPGVKIL
jgi:hypothetical protein